MTMTTPRQLFLAAIPLLGLMACSGSDGGLGDDADARRGMAFAIESVSPASGTQLGGTTITISGEGFTEADNMVVIGDLVATDVTFVSETEIQATTPPGTGGVVDVTVFSPNGFGTLGSGYEYFARPTITAVSPDIVRPGATITLTGSGYSDNGVGTPDIRIGAGDCGSVVVNSDTEATCRLGDSSGPAFSPLDVVLSNENGEAAFSSIRAVGPGLLFITRQGTLAFVDPDEDVPESRIVSQDLPQGLHSVATAGDGVYFARNRNDNSLVRIDLIGRTTTTVGNLLEQMTDFTFVGNQLIALRRRPAANDSNRLVRIDTSDASKTPIALNIEILPMDTQRLALATLVGNKVLMAGVANQPIYEADVATGEFVEKIPASAVTQRVRSMTRYNGKIYGIRQGLSLPPAPGGGGGAQATLVHIDPMTGAMTDIAALPNDAHGITTTN